MIRFEFVESRRAFQQLSPIDTDPVSLRGGAGYNQALLGKGRAQDAGGRGKVGQEGAQVRHQGDVHLLLALVHVVIGIRHLVKVVQGDVPGDRVQGEVHGLQVKARQSM